MDYFFTAFKVAFGLVAGYFLAVVTFVIVAIGIVLAGAFVSDILAARQVRKNLVARQKKREGAHKLGKSAE